MDYAKAEAAHQAKMKREQSGRYLALCLSREADTMDTYATHRSAQAAYRRNRALHLRRLGIPA